MIIMYASLPPFNKTLNIVAVLSVTIAIVTNASTSIVTVRLTMVCMAM